MPEDLLGAIMALYFSVALLGLYALTLPYFDRWLRSRDHRGK
jgi:hypothetical protein